MNVTRTDIPARSRWTLRWLASVLLLPALVSGTAASAAVSPDAAFQKSFEEQISHVRYPRSAGAFGEWPEGDVEVRFQVRGGAVVAPEVVRRSGFYRLDRAALGVVAGMNGLPDTEGRPVRAVLHFRVK